VRLNWRKWGLRGMRFGKRLIFTLEDVEAAEKRNQAAGPGSTGTV